MWHSCKFQVPQVIEPNIVIDGFYCKLIFLKFYSYSVSLVYRSDCACWHRGKFKKLNCYITGERYWRIDTRSIKVQQERRRHPRRHSCKRRLLGKDLEAAENNAMGNSQVVSGHGRLSLSRVKRSRSQSHPHPAHRQGLEQPLSVPLPGSWGLMWPFSQDSFYMHIFPSSKITNNPRADTVLYIFLSPTVPRQHVVHFQ